MLNPGEYRFLLKGERVRRGDSYWWFGDPIPMPATNFNLSILYRSPLATNDEIGMEVKDENLWRRPITMESA